MLSTSKLGPGNDQVSSPERLQRTIIYIRAGQRDKRDMMEATNRNGSDSGSSTEITIQPGNGSSSGHTSLNGNGVTLFETEWNGFESRKTATGEVTQAFNKLALQPYVTPSKYPECSESDPLLGIWRVSGKQGSRTEETGSKLIRSRPGRI